MNETESAFAEIQNVGMGDIGTACTFEIGGAKYNGIINNPDTATQMMTGGYQGRAVMVIIATRGQFATTPSQRADLTITAPDLFKASQWRMKEVEVFGASHYALTCLHQLPSP